MTTGKALILAALAAASLTAGGCFTGVESTPRIDASAVRREHAATQTAEQKFLSDLKAQAPAQWQKGKRFRVADNRIARIFSAHSDQSDNLQGHDIKYEGMSAAQSLTGDNDTELRFSGDDGRQFFYSVRGLDISRIDTMSTLSVPFTIDVDLVDGIDKAMRGNVYYIRTSAWYRPTDGGKEDGLRHIQVRIDSVVPGDAYFPAKVCFSVVDPSLDKRTGGQSHAVYMSVGTARSATRNFDTLFAFDNPRKAYPEISDEVWELIISSKVREGMSRDECRLALGQAPEVVRTPTYAGMREVWSYSDGVFLIFDDGFLTRFRL